MRRVAFETPVRLALAALSMLMLAGCLPVDRGDAVPQSLADSAEVARYSRIRIWETTQAAFRLTNCWRS